MDQSISRAKTQPVDVNKEGLPKIKERPTNQWIGENTRPSAIMYIFKKEIISIFTKCLISQHPFPPSERHYIYIMDATQAFDKYIQWRFNWVPMQDKFDHNEYPIQITYQMLDNAITESSLGAIIEVRRFNGAGEYMKNIVDLGALARNVFYDIVRDHIIDND